MTTIFPTADAPAAGHARPGIAGTATWRIVLIGGVALAVVLAEAVASGPFVPGVDADLLRLMRAMALIKGGFAVVAAALCYWRLARPMPFWRASASVGGTWIMAAGAVAIWHMRYLGPASIGLHGAMFGLIFLSLTDRDFFPASRRFGRRGA